MSGRKVGIILPRVLIVAALLSSIHVLAQADPNVEQGMKPYGSFMSSDIDSVSLTNGNLTLHIPLVSYPQRGGKLSLSFFLRSNNKGFWITSLSGNSWWNFDGVGVDVARDQLREYQSITSNYTVYFSDGSKHTYPVTVHNTITPDGGLRTTSSNFLRSRQRRSPIPRQLSAYEGSSGGLHSWLHL